MKFIIGLGNPGIRYQRTRHNIGRAVVEFIAETERVVFKRDKKMNAMSAEIEWAGEAVRIVYPEVFMNLSGEVLERVRGYFPIEAKNDILIAVDDVAIPFGTLRLRGQGSSGGHNGLKSVAAALGTEEYARLRLGIAAAESTDAGSGESDENRTVPLHDFVLDVFTEAEQKELPDFLFRAKEACRLWVEGPLDRAMSTVNQRTVRG